ncbi:hypothetical protein BV898_16994 [Hypsibius exemplaris]|uniref:G-protein coupled receptors family 1 profile domain-containing protein n=1 Tax=Hypsibius exemplaris TaxID=2072580 RepID=A0A9X6NE76_HYPEX|nr:hypothetical protein BV898_16994 [Hypsibius exemplaris]
MSFNESILSGSLNSSDRNTSICTVSVEQFNAQNFIALLVASATVAAQLFNILIFRFFSIGLHAAPWTPIVIFLARLALSGFLMFHKFSMIMLLFISLDRWLSVEFAIKYRAHIFRPQIKCFVVLSWLITFLSSVRGCIVYWKFMSVMCDRPTRFQAPGTGFMVWSIVTGPLILIPPVVLQFRIAWIAAWMKLRLRGRKVTERNPQRLTQTMIRQLGQSLLASVAVVAISVIANLPYNIILFTGAAANVMIQRLANNLFLIQHFYTPFVYLLFFKRFRVTVLRLCGQYCFTRDRSVGDRLTISRPNAGGEPGLAAMPTPIRDQSHQKHISQASLSSFGICMSLTR